MNAPCKGCDLRHTGCHSECPEYLAYSEEKRRINAIRRKEVDTWLSVAHANNHSKHTRRKKSNEFGHINWTVDERPGNEDEQ